MSNILTHIEHNRQDAVAWQVSRWFEAAGDDPVKKGSATDKVVWLLAIIKNEFIRENYVDNISKKYKISKGTLGAKIKDRVEDSRQQKSENGAPNDEDMKVPEWMDKVEILEKGFCAVNKDGRVGYYTYSPTSGKTQITNFLLHPLFHVRSEDNSRHIFKIENHKGVHILDAPSKIFTSIEALNEKVISKGNFLFFGNKNHLLRISSELLDHFPMCEEIKRLGWQKSYGFFAFLDRIFIPGAGFKEINQHGIVEIGEQRYLLPASSDIYKHLSMSDDDPYENDRVMQYKQASVSFETWCKQMQRVYLEKGLTAIAFVFLTIFRDVVFKVDNNCPHLYGYGETSSGKSKWAESICALFYINRSAFSLNSGTDYAFFEYKQRFANCPHHLNEFDDKITKDIWFMSLKNDYDGEGRERGSVKGSGNSGRVKTEVQRLTGALIITGQFLSTKDDNSVINRSIMEAFSVRDLNDDDKNEFEKLKRWQESGLTSFVTEILQHREMIKRDYYGKFTELLSNWIKRSSEQLNKRILQNHCHLSTMWWLFKDLFKLPVHWAEFDEMMYNKAVELSKFVRQSDSLSAFWKMVGFLIDQQTIIEGWDYKIEVQKKIQLRKGDGSLSYHEFKEPTKVLMLRLNDVHAHYQEAHRRQTGDKAMTLESLIHYFSSRPYYVGNIKSTRFRRWLYKDVEVPMPGAMSGSPTTVQNQKKLQESNTSAFVFVYDMLGCDFEREASTEEVKTELPFGGDGFKIL